ncbi:MAG: hypothetical protein Tsb0017_07230 [Geothermobacteraceae bacterium]
MNIFDQGRIQALFPGPIDFGREGSLWIQLEHGQSLDNPPDMLQKGTNANRFRRKPGRQGLFQSFKTGGKKKIVFFVVEANPVKAGRVQGDGVKSLCQAQKGENAVKDLPFLEPPGVVEPGVKVPVLAPKSSDDGRQFGCRFKQFDLVTCPSEKTGAKKPR